MRNAATAFASLLILGRTHGCASATLSREDHGYPRGLNQMRKTLSRAHDAAAESGGRVGCRRARAQAMEDGAEPAMRTSRSGSGGSRMATNGGVLGRGCACPDAACGSDGSVPRSQQQGFTADTVSTCDGSISRLGCTQQHRDWRLSIVWQYTKGWPARATPVRTTSAATHANMAMPSRFNFGIAARMRRFGDRMLFRATIARMS